jgi:hypothetical protein
MKRVGLWAAIGIGIFITVGLITVGPGYAEEKDHAPTCTLATLNGVYVFTATGYNIVESVPQPKAIVEVIDFNGDGTLTVPAATVSINGVIRRTIDGSGSYTVDEDCTGTITFAPSAPNFDIFIAPNGKEFYLIQTDPNTVLAAVARRVSRK